MHNHNMHNRKKRGRPRNPINESDPRIEVMIRTSTRDFLAHLKRRTGRSYDDLVISALRAVHGSNSIEPTSETHTVHSLV